MSSAAEPRVITPPNNVAWRCRTFVYTTYTHSGGNVDVAFGNALGIKSYDTDNPEHQDLARASITGLRNQQRLVLSALTHFPKLNPELYAPIEQANAVLASMSSNVQRPLQSFSQFLSPEYALALGWAANLLPALDGTPDMLATSEALNDIITLKARLIGMQFPVDVHVIIEQLFKDLEQQIITANFEGSASIDRACRRVISEMTSASEVLRAAAPNLSEEQGAYLNEAASKIVKVGRLSSDLVAVNFAQQLIPLGFTVAEVVSS